jgi:hypothetical protein
MHVRSPSSGSGRGTALADLLGIEHVEARRVVTAAKQVIPQTDLQGQLLPATAEAFTAGQPGVGTSRSSPD